jgi:hypothetical protein
VAHEGLRHAAMKAGGRRDTFKQLARLLRREDWVLPRLATELLAALLPLGAGDICHDVTDGYSQCHALGINYLIFVDSKWHARCVL